MHRMRQMDISRFKPLIVSFIFNTILIYGILGCTTLHAKPSFEVGQIYQVSDQTLLTVESLIPYLLDADVIFLGEEHYTPFPS